MVPLTLTTRQRADLDVILAHTPSARERCRAQELLWLAVGTNAGEIAELLYVSRPTVYNCVGRYHERDGLSVLRDSATPRGPGGLGQAASTAGCRGDRLGPARTRRSLDSLDRPAVEPLPE